MKHVEIAATGTANLASIIAAFKRLGAGSAPSTDPDRILAADYVMLPGVGAFGASMAVLRDHGLDQALRERMEANRPTMAICVGHQLLFKDSEESPGVDGLGLIDHSITRFGRDVCVPQFGWNHVEAGEGCFLLDSGYAYFANSYLAKDAPGWLTATGHHGEPFIAAMEKGNLISCQFHPELSSYYGEALLSRFLELSSC